MTILKTTLGVLLLALSTACSSGDDTYTDGGGELLIMPLSRDATSNGYTLTAAELSFRAISLEPCVPDAALLRTHDFSIDLFHEPAPSVGFISSVTDFCGLTVEIGPALAMDLPDLYGSSARFQGTNADGAAFTLTSTLDTTLSFATDKPVDAMNLVLGADLGAWLANVDPTDAAVTDDGVFVDADHDPDALAAFDQATSAAVALYEDTNADGNLTNEELVPVATATQQ